MDNTVLNHEFKQIFPFLYSISLIFFFITVTTKVYKTQTAGIKHKTAESLTWKNKNKLERQGKGMFPIATLTSIILPTQREKSLLHGWISNKFTFFWEEKKKPSLILMLKLDLFVNKLYSL